MKALTLHQPWASLVALGVKRIETRSWSTRYRGPLAIHAGKAMGGWDEPGIGDVLREACTTLGEPFERWPSGAVVATCTLVDVVPMVDGATRVTKGASPPLALVIVEPGILWNDGTETTLGITRPVSESAAVVDDVSDQRPFGDYAPGRFAWLLDDIKPTTERCPACWGSPPKPPQMFVPGSEKRRRADVLCRLCGGAGSCDPIPAKGRQGLWEWTP